MQHLEAVPMLNNSRLQQTIKATWADLGCGEGVCTKALATQLQAKSRIFAVDTSSVIHQLLSIF